MIRQLPDWVQDFRPGQQEAIDEIVDHYTRGTELVILDAPTGAGKTLIAEAVRQRLGVTGVYVPHTITLQQQFIKDFDAPLLMGRANYPVRFMGMDLTAADCLGKACRFCPNGCPYQEAKTVALRSELSTLNTSYWLHQVNSGALADYSFSGRGIAILDEADQLRNELMRYVSVRVGDRKLRELKLPDIGHGGITKPEAWANWVEQAIPTVRALLRATPEPKNPSDARTIGLIRKRLSLKRLGQQLHGLERGLKDGGWVYTGKNRAVEFKPTRTESLGQQYVWQHAQRFLLMSATWVCPELEIEQLGWDELYAVVTMPSSFPAERRPVKVVPVADMSRNGRANHPEAVPEIAYSIIRLYEKHNREPMLVHAVSYDLTKRLVELLGDDGNVWAYWDSAGRQPALDAFTQHGGILIAPSMDRGVDLPDGLCRVIVIAKLPYPDLSDRQISAQLHDGRTGQLWYNVQTIRTVVQMSGRGMRHSLDTCTTYILDSGFVPFHRKTKGLWPKWWAEALDWRSGL